MANELKPCPHWMDELRKILREDMENFHNLRILTCVEEFYRNAMHTRPVAPVERLDPTYYHETTKRPQFLATEDGEFNGNEHPAPVEGLETFGRVDETGDDFILEHEFQNAVCFSKDNPFDVFTRELVTRSQAEAIIAAKDDEITNQDEMLQFLREALSTAEADTAALTARVRELEEALDKQRELDNESTLHHYNRAKALETELAAARKALEFYADASKWDDGYFKSEDDGTVLRAYPSSIEKDQGDQARATLEGSNAHI